MIISSGYKIAGPEVRRPCFLIRMSTNARLWEDPAVQVKVAPWGPRSSLAVR
jgi:hypothetical protein